MEKTIYSDRYRAVLDLLRSRREEKGMSMRDLAVKLGVHHSWIGKVELGERRLDLMEYASLCAALDLDPQDGLLLMLRKKPKTPKSRNPQC